MNEVCPFSRQIEGYCETSGKKNPPLFLTEHYEVCEKCRPLFLKLGKQLEKLESLIPLVRKEDVGSDEKSILKKLNQFGIKRKKRFFSFD